MFINSQLHEIRLMDLSADFLKSLYEMPHFLSLEPNDWVCIHLGA
jgi:hypothetical protein